MVEQNELENQKIDLLFYIRVGLRYARHYWFLAVVLVALCAGLLTLHGVRSYTPVYEASVSFTVRNANPLYASNPYYNMTTATQLNSTFPYILRSEILKQRVKDKLGVSSIPSVNTTVLSQSNIFTISVRDQDPEWAYEVLQAVVECYPQVAEYVVGYTDLTLLDDSGVPTEPVQELSLKRYIAYGVAGGFVLWAALILLLVLARRTIHNEAELKKMLSFQCLGIIPATKKTGKDMRCPTILSDKGKYGFAESIRLLQLHVEKELSHHERSVMVVSSAIPGEGKSTISVNLAISFARRGFRTLIVDCDQYHPSVMKFLGIPSAPSMKDYISGKISHRDLLVKTGISHLYGMATDVDFKDAAAKSSMETLLKAARETFDVVILDTPPCSLMVDTAELSDLADCALMVIRQDYASRDQILEGVRLLTDSGLPLIGSTLNGVSGNLESNGGRYGNGYGYGSKYGYGYGYGSKKIDY